jgi:hypothetical protein
MGNATSGNKGTKKGAQRSALLRNRDFILNGVVNPAFESRFWGCACFVGNDLPVFKQKQCWNATHTKGGCGGGVAIDIHLDHFDFALHFDRKLFE